MKKIFFLCTAISFFSSSYAQTPVPAGNVSGNWALSGSPYNVEGNIVVPGGQTLTIEAGVQVIFDSLYQFDIQGRIMATGTATSMITFTAADTTVAKWHGIKFDHTPASNDTSVFDYCNIMYSDSSAISCLYFSKIRISNSVISYNTGKNGAGVLFDHSGGMIYGTTFQHNHTINGTASFGGAIFINSCANGSMITNNTFTSNSANASAFFVYGLPDDNMFVNAYGGSISISASNNIGITGNIFSSNNVHAAAYHNTGYLNAHLYAKSFGGVVYIGGSHNINISNNDFVDNSATALASGGSINSYESFGGGIYIDSSEVSFADNSFTTNSAQTEGGALSIKRCHNISSSCLITTNTFESNSASNGGALSIIESDNIDLTYNGFQQNSASDSGAAIYLQASNNIVMAHDKLSSNSAGYGGGVLVSRCPNVYLTDNEIKLNNASAGNGGGILVQASFVYLKNNLISSNTAASAGGGVYISNTTVNTATNPYFESNIISNNTVTGGSGSGVYLNTVNPKLYNNIISGNKFTDPGSYGGGIYMYNSNAKIINNAVVYNSASGDGGGIYFTNGSSPLLANSILYGNTCATHFQLYINDNNSAPVIIYCDVQYDSVGLAPGVIYNLANCTNNIGSNPVFVNFAVENFHLSASSLCKNAGTPDTVGLNLPANDLDGNVRIYNGRIDIGPYEYGAPLTIENVNVIRQLMAYPVPATSQVAIRNTDGTVMNGLLEIQNMQGQIVHSEKISFQKEHTIDVSQFANGIYIFRLQNDTDCFTGKIVIRQ